MGGDGRVVLRASGDRARTPGMVEAHSRGGATTQGNSRHRAGRGWQKAAAELNDGLPTVRDAAIISAPTKSGGRSMRAAPNVRRRNWKMHGSRADRRRGLIARGAGSASRPHVIRDAEFAIRVSPLDCVCRMTGGCLRVQPIRLVPQWECVRTAKGAFPGDGFSGKAGKVDRCEYRSSHGSIQSETLMYRGSDLLVVRGIRGKLLDGAIERHDPILWCG